MAGERKISVLGREYPIIELDSVPDINTVYSLVSGKTTIDQIASQIEKKLKENYTLLAGLPQKAVCLVYKTPTGLEGVLTTELPEDYILAREFEEWFRKQKSPAHILLHQQSRLDLRSIQRLNEAETKEVLKRIYISNRQGNPKLISKPK